MISLCSSLTDYPIRRCFSFLVPLSSFLSVWPVVGILVSLIANRPHFYFKIGLLLYYAKT